MTTRLLPVGLSACLALAAHAPARAYQVQPLVSHAKPSGSGSTVRMVIKNTDPAPITLELTPFRVSVDEDGVESRTPDESALLVFPPQTVVPPNKEQAIQVRYVGGASPPQDQIYGVLITQAPVQFQQLTASPEAQTDLKVGFNFRAYLIVDAPGAKASAALSPVVRRPDGNLSLQIENTGGTVSLLHGASWVFTDAAGKSVTLDADHVDTGEFGALLPGHKRTITVDGKTLAGLSGEVRAAVQLK